MVSKNAFWRNALRYLLFTAALGAFVLAVLPNPPQFPADTSDKAQHMLAFAVLTLLARFAYPQARNGRLFIILAGFGALIELVQAYPPLHRDADLWDWVADMAAILAVLMVCHPLVRRANR